MNYLSIYNSIINRAETGCRRKRKHADPTYVYYERHHIIPKCVGGTNDKTNLILLTADEHYLAHQLLVKIYPTEHKLVFALRMMCANNKNQRRNNKEYSWIRKLNSETQSVSQKGKSYGCKFTKGHTMSTGAKNGMFGKTHTKVTKDLQSEIALKRPTSHYDSARLPKSKEHKENIQKSKQTRKYKLTSPDGTISIFNRCQEASNFSGIAVSALIKLAGNRYKFDRCKGWKCEAIPAAV